MIKLSKWFVLCILVFSANIGSASDEVTSVEEYNSKLPVLGISWRAGANAVSVYYPSFYTGFAPRQENADRTHIRLSRGNQTRMTTILDDNTVLDYLYDLKTRADFYTELQAGKYINIAPKNSALIPHVEYFKAIVAEGSLDALEHFDNGEISKESLYLSSLDEIKKLNPGRVFSISIDLAESFLNWRNNHLTQDTMDTESSSQSAMVLANHMVWGRVNLTRKLNADELSVLASLAENSSVLSEEGFVQNAYELFKSITGEKYSFKVVDEETGRFKNATVCSDNLNCTLNYTELSSIYPTGTLKASTRDKQGNRITKFATPGLHTFIDSGSRGDVDNIRKEPYYGFAPKMDFEGIGNGFHNPAVRVPVGKAMKKTLRIPARHNQFWPVKRGGVSHGCERIPLGHIWEMRNRMPVANASMKKVFYFGNGARDFDVFDIDGDGSLEVMGVKYYIKYKLNGSSGLAKREGNGLINSSKNVKGFFNGLYGKNKVFEQDEELVKILNPSASIQTVNDVWTGQASFGKSKSTVKSNYVFRGSYRLYEQNYEQDKVQFYTSYKIRGFNSKLTGGGKFSLGKRFVRLMGRVKGCAPFSDKDACGEKAFKAEKAQIFKEIR